MSYSVLGMFISEPWGPCCAVFKGPCPSAGWPQRSHLGAWHDYMCCGVRVAPSSWDLGRPRVCVRVPNSSCKMDGSLFAMSGGTQDTLDLVIDAFTTESRRLSAKATKDDGQRSPDWPVAE